MHSSGEAINDFQQCQTRTEAGPVCAPCEERGKVRTSMGFQSFAVWGCEVFVHAGMYRCEAEVLLGVLHGAV